MKNKPPAGKLFFSLTLEYLDIYLPTQAGKSPKTIKSYRDSLTVFRRFLYEDRNISISRFLFTDCTRDLVLDFISYLKKHGNAPGTCNQRLTAIKTYIWYAADLDISLQSLALSISRIPPSKKATKLKECMSEEALTVILAEPPNTRIGLRDRTIMILLYDSAIRLSEVLGLKVENLNLKADNPYIRVFGKGSKERIVAITPQTANHLENYISIYHKASSVRDGYLFYSKIKGSVNVMSSGNVERIIQKYAVSAREKCSDVPVKVYPHMFRNQTRNKIQTSWRKVSSYVSFLI